MAGRSCWAVGAGLASLLVVLLSLTHSTNAVLLQVTYPTGSFSEVTLKCVDGTTVVGFTEKLTGDQLPATFLRNGSPITASSVAQLVEQDSDEIRFIFNQTQEGRFSCRTADDVDSTNVEKLAGIVVCEPGWCVCVRDNVTTTLRTCMYSVLCSRPSSRL